MWLTPVQIKPKSFLTTWSVVKQMSDIIWVVCNKLTTVWAPTKKLLVSWQFSGPYGVTKYGSGWRKDVVNQCLELGPHSNLAIGGRALHRLSLYLAQPRFSPSFGVESLWLNYYSSLRALWCHRVLVSLPSEAVSWPPRPFRGQQLWLWHFQLSPFDGVKASPPFLPPTPTPVPLLSLPSRRLLLWKRALVDFFTCHLHYWPDWSEWTLRFALTGHYYAGRGDGARASGLAQLHENWRECC